MKRSIGAICAICAGLLSTKAQSWQTADDFQMAIGGDNEAMSIAAGSSGVLYAAGGFASGTSGAANALVRASFDGGLSWEVIDAAPDSGSYYSGITVAASGSIIAAGTVNETGWYVRRSADQGASWQTVDWFEPAPGGSAFANCITSDLLGNIYVAGYAKDGSLDHWIVRKSSDDGLSWTTADDFVPGGQSANAAGIACAADGSVYVCGTHTVASKKSKVQVWTVRRSAGGTGPWTTVDSYAFDSSYDTFSTAVCTDGAGSVFVTGHGSTVVKGVTRRHWMVRRSSNGGSSWQNIDDYTAPGSNALPYAVLSDANGDLYVAGQAQMAVKSYMNWLVRKLPAGSSTWSISDNFSYGTVNQLASGLASTPAGVFAIGSGSNGNFHWLARKLAR